MYWVVDPDAETVTVFRLSEARYESMVLARGDCLASDLFPGIEIPVAHIFVSR